MSRFIGSGRLREGGLGAVHSKDFRAHHQGEDFRHGALDIEMEPVLTNFSGTTVQATLEELANAISSAGSGFVSVGNVGPDGYSAGSYNVGAATTPTFESAMAAAIADPRLTNGGVILILAGTYTMSSTVTIPAGISVMGEIAGTIVIGEMLEQPMFYVSRGQTGTTIGGNSGGGNLEAFPEASLDKTRFFNLILSDNLNGTVTSGPSIVSSMQTVPMIHIEKSSRVEFDQVRFLGRVNDGTVTGRGKTLAAIGTTTGGGTGTYLSVKNCFIDGVKVGINFTPNNGVLDTLSVQNTRARTFGTEDSGSLAETDNCFINMSLCNADLINNYHVGADDSAAATADQTVRYCYVVSSAVTGAFDVRINILGTQGGPSGDFANYGLNLFVDTTNSGLKAIKNGNNWGSSYQNNWFVTIGNASPSFYEPSGDLTGPEAFNLLFQSPQGSANQTTVVVNPGTYTLQRFGSSGLLRGRVSLSGINIIGNKVNGAYPVINLDIADGSLGVGNSLLNLNGVSTGSVIKGIHFVGINATRMQYVKVELTDGNADSRNNMIVEDCIFENVTLFTGPFTGLTAKATGVRMGAFVRDCVFKQDGTYTDNISLLLPALDTVEVSRCHFSGNGYALGIGDGTSFTTTGMDNPNIKISDCTMDLTGSTISALSRLDGVSADRQHYVWVIDEAANVVMDNCQIYADNTLVGSAPIDVGILDDFKAFVSLSGETVEVSNCVFNTPRQVYDNGGVDYALAGVRIIPQHSLNYVNNRTFGSALPLQIGNISNGSSPLSNLTNRGGLNISNNEFIGYDLVAYTLLDVDLDLDAAANLDESGRIIVHGNLFRSTNDNLSFPTLHTELTGSDYDAQGIVQIYAPDYDVIVTSNKIYGELGESTALGTPYNHYAGLVVNTYSGTNASAQVRVNKVFVADNDINCTNFGVADASAALTASAAYLKASVMQVSGNYLRLVTEVAAATGGHFSGCLVIDNLPTTSNPYSEAMVQNNVFSRRADTGLAFDLLRGYVLIGTGSGRGVLTDNAFSDPTIDGSSTTAVEDNSTAGWFIERNKNQTKTVTVMPSAGLFRFGRSTTNNIGVYDVENDGYIGTPHGLEVQSLDEPTTTGSSIQAYQYRNSINTETVGFAWSYTFANLPHGVYIEEASINVRLGATTPSGFTSTANMFLFKDRGGAAIGSAVDLTALAPFAEQTITITPPDNTYKVDGQMVLEFNIGTRDSSAASSNIVVLASPVSLTYRW